jgi:hypothetical protein
LQASLLYLRSLKVGTSATGFKYAVVMLPVKDEYQKRAVSEEEFQKRGQGYEEHPYTHSITLLI